MKLVIVTGGSRGLGAALVQHFTAQPDCHTLELSRSGRCNVHINCDLSQPESVAATAGGLFNELANEQWSEILLFSNAGLLNPIVSGRDLTVEAISENIAVNQTSAFTLITTFMNAFRRHNCPKTIINVSSGAAHTRYPGWSLYCASKAATEHFIRTLAAEEQQQTAPYTLVNYDPGIMDTAMQAVIRQSDIQHFPNKERFVQYKEDGALKTPEYVANDLISQLNSGVTSGERYAVE